jgi:hypothetical protein
MARNDIVLLDSLISKSRDRYSRTDDSELFELYVFDQLLKQHEPSFDDLEAGWTDGGNDGGIDGFYICVDDRIATENVSEYALRKGPLVTVYIITARRSSKFEQQAIDSLTSSLGELLDLTLNESELKYPYNQEVLEQRTRFREIYISLADRQPNLQINVIYASRAENSEPAPNVKSRGVVLFGTLQNLFSNAKIDIRFAGADELLSLSRKGLDLQIRLPLAEPPISREGNRFIILCSLPDYFRAVCDETGALKRYLFDSNVRGYLGNGAVNADIMSTLNTQDTPNGADFWWLNNGVTVLATNAWVMAKEIIVENAQIVNGLQTTETVYGYFSKGGSLDDKRTIVLKIIVAVDADVRARIVKATNYQSTIDLAQLRGLDKIQRDIDDFLLDNGWFYDRRAHVYKNMGKPADRIISIPYLAAAVRAIALREPARSQRQRSRSLRDNEVYRVVFNEKWDLRVYLVCIEIARATERALNARRSGSWWNAPPMALSHFVSFVYVCERMGKFDYEPEDIIQLANQPPTEEDVLRITADLSRASKRSLSNERRVKGVLLNSVFMEAYIREKLAIR